jgi:hypothetical protein
MVVVVVVVVVVLSYFKITKSISGQNYTQFYINFISSSDRTQFLPLNNSSNGM